MGEIEANVFDVLQTINPKEVERYEKLVQLITQECDKLNPYTPGIPLSGAAPLAFKDTSVQQWLNDQGATGFAYFMVTFICTGVIGVHPRDCGLYFLLEMIKSCGGWDDMISDCGPNGGQHFKVKTGMHTRSAEIFFFRCHELTRSSPRNYINLPSHRP